MPRFAHREPQSSPLKYHRVNMEAEIILWQVAGGQKDKGIRALTQ